MKHSIKSNNETYQIKIPLLVPSVYKSPVQDLTSLGLKTDFPPNIDNFHSCIMYIVLNIKARKLLPFSWDRCSGEIDFLLYNAL